MTSTIIDRQTGLLASSAFKAPCITASTTNISLSGLQTISTVAVAEGARVLVAGQSAGAQNGIYRASSGVWERAPDWQTSGEVVEGTTIRVTDGSVAGSWVVISSDPIVIGTTSVSIVLDVPDVGVVIPTVSVATIAALKALSLVGIVDGARVHLIAGATVGDGKEGGVIYRSSLATTGDDAIYFTPNVGSGRWVREEFITKRELHVRWWGADPTAVADSAPAFTAMFAAFLGAGGQRVRMVVAAGFYILNSTIDLATAGMVLRGDGRAGATILRGNHNAGPVMKMSGIYQSISDIEIDSSASRIAGSRTDGGGLPNVGLLILASDCEVERVRVVNQPNSGILMVGAAYRNLLLHITSTGHNGHGICIDPGDEYGITPATPGLVEIIQPTINSCAGHAIRAGRKAGGGALTALRVIIRNLDSGFCATDPSLLSETALVYIRGRDSLIEYSAVQSPIAGMSGYYLESCSNVEVIKNRFFVDTYNVYINGSTSKGILIDGMDTQTVVSVAVHVNPAAPDYCAIIIPGETANFTTLYDGGTIQSDRRRTTTWAPMTGASNRAAVYDVATVTLPQLAGRVRAIQDLLTLWGAAGP